MFKALSIRKFHFNWLLKAKNGLCNPGQNFCLVPRPSARTKYFLSRTILKLSRTKILSMVKNSIFCFQKSFKMNISCWKQIFKALSIKKSHFNWLLKAKNGLFNPGQNFCPGKLQNCPGQKIFCPGRWTGH